VVPPLSFLLHLNFRLDEFCELRRIPKRRSSHTRSSQKFACYGAFRLHRSLITFACGARRLWWRRLGLWLREIASRGRTTIEAKARSDGLRLLRTIDDTQAHGEEGARADPTRAAHEAGLDVGSERYQGAMAYLIEQAALLADEHTAFDVGDQHPHGYASYFFTRRAVKLLEED
jgi:hypothetical protein